MKARIERAGGKWSLQVAKCVVNVDSFADAVSVFDGYRAQTEVAHWMDIYKQRMGTEAQTRGMA